MNMVAKTDRGRIRESNQDAYFVGEMPDGTAFAVVCDGMGGAAGGNIASSLAVQVISSKINASYHPQYAGQLHLQYAGVGAVCRQCGSV